MQLLKKLSLAESQQFQKIQVLFPSDRKTQQTCINYYLSYKQQSGYNLNDDKVGIALKCAFFMAEKSQSLFNMKGEKVRGIGLSLSQLLKSHKLDDIMIMLKDFSKKVKISDEQAQSDINTIIKQISFLITFCNKFDKTIQKLELKQRVCESYGYTKTFVSFIWLLYIQAKNRVLDRSLDLIENTCMLAQTIAFMLFYAWDYIRPMVLMKGDKKLTEESTSKEVSMAIKEKVLDIFLIKNIDTYKSIAKSFEEYFQQLVDNKLIKVSSNKINFLSPQLLNTNYKKLDLYFQKTLNSYDIDERIFYKERTTNLTPSKFTPFSRQGYANKGNAKTKLGGRLNQKENFNSHRILTYEMMDRQQPQQRNMPVAEMKLPKTVLQTPSTIKVPLICSTPITAGMQMYNYLTEKVRRVQNKYQIDLQIQSIINNIMVKEKKQNQRTGRLQKKKMISYLHCYLLEEYLRCHSSESKESLSRAFLVLSTQLVFFVSNVSMSFEEIQSEIQTTVLDQWKACDYLIKFDKSMPQPLKLHLLDLQISIISHKIWKDPQLVQLLQLCANGEQIDTLTDGDESIVDRCLRTVLVQIGVQISQISKTLKLDEKVAEGVFDTMKEILLSQIDMIENRHLDQLIICAFYVNCRVGQIDVKFNEIKEKYEEANLYNKALHQELIFKVYMEGESPVDIIRFYNSVFIMRMKKFTKILQERGQGNYQGQGRRNTVLQSPLKTIIPRQVTGRQKNKPIGGKSAMTPQTHLLYAYNESPILKHQFQHSFRQARKAIDFEDDDIEKKFVDHQQNINTDRNTNGNITTNTTTTTINQNININTATNDYVSRKFVKKGSQICTPIPSPSNNHSKYSPTVSTKGVHSPISLSQFQSQFNPNGQIKGDTTNINNNNHPISLRLNPTHQQHEIGPLNFNPDLTRKYTHNKHPSGGINFATLNDRRS